MTGQIPTISNGTLIDQSLLSRIITNVNEISNTQYSSLSPIATGLSSTQQNLQTGQWGVATVYKTEKIASYSSKPRITGPIQIEYGMTFDTVPIITGSIYSSNPDSVARTTATSIVFSDVRNDGATCYVVAATSTEAAETLVGLMFTIIGKVPKS